MKKELKGPGKGMGPIKGYNYKNWYSNFNKISWNKKWCAWCGKWSNHTSGSCENLKKHVKSS